METREKLPKVIMDILARVIGGIGNIVNFICNKIAGQCGNEGKYFHEERETFYD